MSVEKPMAGAKIAITFHLTEPVANMTLALTDAGAEIFFIPSKKETVVPSALEMLNKAGVYYRNPDQTDKEKHLREVIDFKPHLIIDNVDLFRLWHSEKNAPPVLGSTVHSKSAYDVVENYVNSGNSLLYPVIGVGSSRLKLELESTLGTGQSVVNALINISKLQLSGKKIAIIGYGNVGSGIARVAKAMGARIMIVGRRAYPALKAFLFDGYEVVSLEEAAKSCDIILTATGGKNILIAEHFHLMRNGAYIGNVGRYQEIDIQGLESIASNTTQIDHNITEYELNGKHIYMMGGGKQFNLVAGEGNSDEIMDLSLALHALSMEYLWKNNQDLDCTIYPVSESITERVSIMKLQHLGVDF